MKRFFSLIVAVVLLASICVVSVNATTAPVGVAGDLNSDWKVDITDATCIQRALAKIDSFDAKDEIFADVDKDRAVTICDVTEIQRWIASISDNNYIGTYFNSDMYTDDFYSDYSSGMAMAGTPVTFTANVRAGSPIQRYELYVNDELVASSETENSLTYTFDEAGTYSVKMLAEAFFSSGRFFNNEYVVVDPYESETPLFKALYSTGKYWGVYAFGQKGMRIYADAIGGTAPYEYKFVFDRRIDDVIYEPEITPETIQTVQEYSPQNYFELPMIEPEYFSSEIYCKMTVFIKDANGNEVSKDMEFYYRTHDVG